jgi:MFS family permease
MGDSTRRLTVILLLVWVVAYLDRMILIILIPQIKASLHISDTQAGLLYGTTFAVFFALAGLPAGRLVDRVNRRNLLIVAMIGWSAATMLSSLAHQFATLLACRIVVGICQAAVAPASISMVNDFCPPAMRGRVTGILLGGASLGASLANMLGGVLHDLFSATAPVSVPGVGVLEPWQTTMLVIGIPGLVLAASMVGITEPARRNVRHEVDFEMLPYLRSRSNLFVPLYVGYGFVFVVGYGLSTWYPVLFMRALKMSPHQAGLAAGLLTLAAAVASALLGGYLSDRFARRDPSLGRLRLARMGVALTAVAVLPLAAPDMTVLLMFSFGIFVTLATTITSIGYTVLPELSPSSARGRFVALYVLIGYMFGLGVAPPFIGFVGDRLIGDESRLNWAMLAVALPSLLLAAVLLTMTVRAVGPAVRPVLSREST